MSASPKKANNGISRPVLILYLVTLVLALALFVFMAIRMQEGREAEKSAQALLEAYQTQTDAAISPTPVLDIQVDPSEIEHVAADNLVVDETAAYVQPDAPEETDPELAALMEKVVAKVGADSVIGVISIPEIEIELPIIAKWSYSLLKTSICRYKGPGVNEKGNLVLIGHNYKSGAHFGRLSKLKEGSEVYLSGADGTAIKYVVYSSKVIEPDDFAALESWHGDYGLMLLTCKNDGTQRLLVKCELATDNA